MSRLPHCGTARYLPILHDNGPGRWANIRARSIGTWKVIKLAISIIGYDDYCQIELIEKHKVHECGLMQAD